MVFVFQFMLVSFDQLENMLAFFESLLFQLVGQLLFGQSIAWWQWALLQVVAVDVSDSVLNLVSDCFVFENSHAWLLKVQAVDQIACVDAFNLHFLISDLAI